MGFTDYKLRYLIEGDNSHLKRAITESEKGFAGLNKTAVGAQAGLKGVASEVSNIVAALTGDRLSGAASQVTSLANAFGAIPGAAGLAVGAIAGMGVAAVGAGAALFSLTKTAAEYGSVIHDASDKTGLHAETLSAMDVAAKQSGTSLDQITTAIAKFTKNVGAGKDELKAFGITPQQAIKDLDGSLGKVFKRIAEAKPGYEQITLAQKAFGKSGADLLPFIKQFDGDLPKLIAKAKELGVTMSDGDVKAADDFGDELAELETQAQHVAATFTRDLMPVFTHAMRDIEGWIGRNKDSIRDWGNYTANVVQGLISYWKQLSDQASDYFGLVKVQGASGNTYSFWAGGLLPLLAERGAQERKDDPENTALMRYRSSIDLDRQRNSGGGLPDFSGKGTKPPKTTDDQFRKFFTDMGFSVERTFGAAINKGSLHPSGKAIDLRIGNHTGDEIAKMVAAAIEKGYRFVDERVKQPGITSTGKNLHFEQNFGEKPSIFAPGSMYGGVPIGLLKDMDARRLGKGPAGTDAVDKYKEDQLKKDEDSFRQYWEFKKDIQRSGVEYLLAQNESEIKIYDETGAAYETATQKSTEIAHLKAQLYQDEIDALEDLFDHTTDLNKQAQIRQQIDLKTIEMQRAAIGIEDERAASVKRLTDKFYDLTAGLKAAESATDDFIKATNGGIQENQHGTGVGGTEIDRHFNAFATLRQHFEDMDSTGAVAGVDAMTTAFSELGGAVGSAVDAFVLYGNAGGSVRQVTAQILASIAQQAAVQSIYELAQGLAVLALAFFGVPNAGPSATAHFAAAAMYGAIAGVTAGIGRGVAGDSFKSKGGGGTHSKAGGPGSTGAYGPGSSSNIDKDPTPYSRASNDAYNSGDRNARSVADAIDRHTAAVLKMDSKLDSMRPGEVLTKGMAEKPGAVGDQVHRDISRNADTGVKIGRAMGIR